MGAEECADDAARRFGALERIELKPFVQQVSRRLRDQFRDAVEFLLAQAFGISAELEQAHQIARRHRRRVRRHQTDHRLDGFGRARHDAAVFLGSLRVARRMAINLAPGLIMIAPLREIVAVVHRRHGTGQRQDFEPMARQLEVTDDFRAQQADDVGKFGEAITGKDFLSDSGPSNNLTTFQHHNLLARTRKIGSSDQTVMTRADDDGVVLVG